MSGLVDTFSSWVRGVGRSRPLLRFLVFVLAGSLGGALLTPAGLRAQAKHPAAAIDSSARVWVNTKSGVYHCPGTRYYGNTKAGVFHSENQARTKGYRPAYDRLCGPVALVPDSAQAAGLIDPEAGAGRVWVNTSSGVYHCPGTRYYGRTKRGEYMTESAAKSRGFRATGGRACTLATTSP